MTIYQVLFYICNWLLQMKAREDELVQGYIANVW